MSLLSLWWYNKMLFRANCLKSPVSQLANSRNISWGIIGDCGDGELSFPLSLGCISPECEVPPGINGQLDPEGESSSWQVGVSASDTQWNLVRHRNQQGEGSTAHQTCKNLGSNSGLPQEAEGDTDPLPMRHPKPPFLRGSHVSQLQKAVWKYCAMWEYKKMRGETQPRRKVSEEFPPTLSVWQSGNRRRQVEIRIKTLPWSVWLITLKRDLMETIKLV
jgi:hypothetical protein